MIDNQENLGNEDVKIFITGCENESSGSSTESSCNIIIKHELDFANFKVSIFEEVSLEVSMEEGIGIKISIEAEIEISSAESLRIKPNSLSGQCLPSDSKAAPSHKGTKQARRKRFYYLKDCHISAE